MRIFRFVVCPDTAKEPPKGSSLADFLFRFSQLAERRGNASSAACVIQRKLHVRFKALAAGQLLDLGKPGTA